MQRHDIACITMIVSHSQWSKQHEVFLGVASDTTRAHMFLSALALCFLTRQAAGGHRAMGLLRVVASNLLSAMQLSDSEVSVPVFAPT